MVEILDTGGLIYRKLDLHIHTPASECFKDKNVRPEDIIKKALDEKLDAIAITDHNSGEWIDRVKEASKGKAIVVFPGVEISCTGGGEGAIHIIAIFDTNCSTKHIENLLGDLHIQAGKYGIEEACTQDSPSNVIDKIIKHGGLAILAHANSTHGVMCDMKGIPRKETINNPNLSAAEATESDFNNEDKTRKKTRVCDFLDGSHPEYRKLAVYQSSDNLGQKGEGHVLDSIGSRYTHFKLDEISLEGIRQCFCDPDVRIKQKEQYVVKRFPVIENMGISQGFLEKQNIYFHDGLNSIVGGKGSGKSLIVEFLRFALNQTSSIESIITDCEEKLKERLKPFGRLTLTIKLENGESYKLVRTYDGNENVIECTNTRTSAKYEGDVSILFPILAYSQNEVIKIAEDETAQLKLIDSFIDTTTYINLVTKLREQLADSDRDLVASIKSASAVASIQKELNTVNEQIQNINISLSNKLFDEMKLMENKKKEYEKYISIHDDLEDQVNQYITNVKDNTVITNIEDEFIADEDIIEAKVRAEKSKGELANALEIAQQRIAENRLFIVNLLNKWIPQYENKKQEYENMLIQAGGDKGKLEFERVELEARKVNLNIEFLRESSLLDRLNAVKKERVELLSQFETNERNRYEVRKKKYTELTTQSNSRLRLSLVHAENPSNFENELINLVRGSGLRRNVCERVVKHFKPSAFIDIVVSNDFKLLAEKADLDEVNAQKLINILNSKEALEEVLALSYACYPEDIPSIEYKKEDGKYYPLAGLSVGQKCSALLIIALSEGTRPVIIDQPEDSLDIASVFEDIVSKLRIGKENRQFILTTHNSSVGVASDSDNFVILKSNASQGYVECHGAIDRRGVKREIIDHLEGGTEPYGLRNRKYNIIKT